MYPQVFEIRINDDKTKFYAGQMVEGRVILTLNKEKAIRGILIRLVGKGNVYWDNGIKHTNVFSDSELYVSNTAHLLVPEDGRQTVLYPGAYEYFFSIKLPTSIPSSIEGQHCFIRYYLEAVIQRPWKDEQTVEAVIHVTGISDLNQFPENAEPSSIQKEKHAGFNICNTGPITLNFMIGKTGFVPGEYLQYGVEIRNQSGTRVNGVHISLKRQLTCQVKGETKTIHDKILQISGPSAEIGGYLLWQNNFELPMLPPSELTNCSIISIKYYVEIKLVLDKWADVKYHMPIIIGTVPYKTNLEFETKTELTCNDQDTPKKSRRNSLALSAFSVHDYDTTTQKQENSWCPDDTWTIKILEDLNDKLVIKENDCEISPPEISRLPPLDLAFFQRNSTENQYFKCFDDSECDFSNTFRIPISKSQELNRPPRPHSNPGHIWDRRNDMWEREDEDE